MAAPGNRRPPLLSGPPPETSTPDPSPCRRCGKEFGTFLNRSRRCMHCGYTYCSSCTNYPALMPAANKTWHPAQVCAFCSELLCVTALERTPLRQISLPLLRRYINAYNIQVKTPIDKDDIVDAIVAARTPEGCLGPAHEKHYREKWVPQHRTSSGPANPPTATRARNFFGRSNSNNPHPSPPPNPIPSRNHGSRFSNASATHSTHSNVSHSNVTHPNVTHPNVTQREFPRPDLDPRNNTSPLSSAFETRGAPSGGQSQPTHSSTRWREPSRSQAMPPDTSIPLPRTPSNTSGHSPQVPPASPVSSTPPPLLMLLTQSRPAIASLPVSVLKKILWEARVRLSPGVCEKEDLVEKVWLFLEEERRMANRNSDGLGQEDFNEEVITVEDEGGEVPSHSGRDNTNVHLNPRDIDMDEVGISDYLSVPYTGTTSRSPTPEPSSTTRKTRLFPEETERSGLCVVCQDEEAIIAIVDCGHLALCPGCSDLVMQQSRECPLCRTRIVTESRLLRIFKT